MAFMKNMSPTIMILNHAGLAHAQREHMNLTHTYTAEFLSFQVLRCIQHILLSCYNVEHHQ
jgi:hypothetical protein